MAQLNFSGSVSFDPNKIISSQEIIDMYLQGVVLSYKNKTLPLDTINSYIEFSQSYVERILNIKLNKQVIVESHDLYYDDWRNWSYIYTNFPVVCANTLDGYFSDYKIVSYPKEWISVQHNSDVSALKPRHIRLVPNKKSIQFYNGNFFGNYLALNGMNFTNNNVQVPNYWLLTYVTGWEPGQVPKELLSIIGRLTAIQMLTSVGEIQFNLIGVNSQSVSLDGLSQSLSTAAGNQHPFSSRLKSLGEQVANDLKVIMQLYTQPTLIVF